MTNQQITLDRLELFLLDLPQKSIFKSGIGIRKSKETLIIKWIDLDGRIGYGECSCRPDPYYSAEFLEASVLLIQQFIAPMLKSHQTYGEVLEILQKIRGWNFTKSAVESAMFQILSQTTAVDFLSNKLDTSPINEIPVGISLGIYTDKKQIHDTVQEAITDGYRRVKFKISPHMDVKILESVNALLFDNDAYVSFDANGSFYEKDLPKLQFFVDTYDTIIEQPTPPGRFDIYQEAKAMFPNLKVCFDEEVKSFGDLVMIHQLGAMDELNLKIGRVGGLTNSIQMLNYCATHNISCWIGGMFETGVGRLQNLALAAYLPSAKAHDLSPSSRYFKEDIVWPEIDMKNGLIDLQVANESKLVFEKLEKYSTRKVVLK